MAHRPVNPPAEGWSLTLPPRIWAELSVHLFGDDQEHAAVLLAGLAEGPRGPRLLASRLILAADRRDYVSGERGSRMLTSDFVREAAVQAHDEQLAYIAVHNHLGLNRVGFSGVDLASHERGYPALRQLTRQIVGGLVLTRYAAAGDLWLTDGARIALAEVIIPAGNLLRLRPAPAAATACDLRHDRQARFFGDLGQETLRKLRVGVVGLGGVGSIIVELLARLGIGHLALIDDDSVDHEGTNLSRLMAAEPNDIDKPKTELAARNARRANPDIDLTILTARVEHPDARQALTTCDWIFLAADGHAARHWVNATVNQYLIPATQASVKSPSTLRPARSARSTPSPASSSRARAACGATDSSTPPNWPSTCTPTRNARPPATWTKYPRRVSSRSTTWPRPRPSTTSCSPPLVSTITTTTSPGSSTARAPGNETS